MKRLHIAYLVLVLIFGLILTKPNTLTRAMAYSVEARAGGKMVKSAPVSKDIIPRAAGLVIPQINITYGYNVQSLHSLDTALEKDLEKAQLQPMTAAVADFDEDGILDVVNAYGHPYGSMLVLHRGNPDTIYPNSPGARQYKDNGEFTDSPFLPSARIFKLPAAFEFIGAGDFDADGHCDVVTADSDQAISLSSGDGRGSFTPARRIELPGRVTSLATGEVNRADGLTDLVAGIVAADGPKLLVFEGPAGALKSKPEEFPMPAQVTALALGQLDEDHLADIAVAAGRDFLIVRGRDRRLSLEEVRRADGPQAQISRQSFPFTIMSMAVGNFAGDYCSEVALLTDAGEVVVLRRDEIKRTGKGGVTGRVSGEQPFSKTAQSAMIFTITTTADSGPGSLRQAILDANSNPGADTINFQIGKGAQTITPTSALPVITDPVAIDGTTQPGFAGTPIIELNGTSAGISNGLHITAGSSLVRGLVINRFNGNALLLEGAGSNRIKGNFIGTDVTGTIDLGNGLTGVRLFSGNNTIGGTAHEDLNIISGNNDSGIYICCGNASGNFVQGNLIGTDITGKIAVGNTPDGVVSQGPGTTIGGTTPRAGNIISGNNRAGVVLFSGALFNLIQGNFIGTDISGKALLGNIAEGVGIHTGASESTIGGTVATARNVISGNGAYGVVMFGGITGELVQGNFIGTNLSGTVRLPNGLSGVEIINTSDNFTGGDNFIGGATAGAANVISGNNLEGVRLSGTFFLSPNQVLGNLIGTDVTGMAGLGNGSHGVVVSQGGRDLIGGFTPEARNIISGNNGNGVLVNNGIGQGGEIFSALIVRNFIGTNATGTAAIGNSGAGILVNIPNFTGIGNNLISGNGQSGIILNDDAGFGILGAFVTQNLIGTDITGTLPLGNSLDGVTINDSGQNRIGTGGSGSNSTLNIISGNGRHGILIQGGSNSFTDNRVIGNFIGTDIAGTNALGNSGNGITIIGSRSVSIGGSGNGSGNRIAFNGVAGINVESGSCLASFNTIFSNASVGIGVQSGVCSIATNSIFSNAGLGIDLELDGVTPNDPGDGDTGPNDLQNFPVLTSANTSVDGITVQGTLNSRPNRSFRIEFFSNIICDSSGFGEGQTFIGSTMVATDGGGNAAFVVTLPVAVPVGQFITATASGSEFSQCIQLGSPFDLCIQDESSGDTLRINSATGEYLFTNCGSRLVVGGVGNLNRKGSIITLRHDTNDRRVSASIDVSSNRATASVQLFSQDRTFTLIDRNIGNNTCHCL